MLNSFDFLTSLFLFFEYFECEIFFWHALYSKLRALHVLKKEDVGKNPGRLCKGGLSAVRTCAWIDVSRFAADPHE